MVLLATLFLDNPDFRAGTILLGISPCTGMVLFWIAFARGNVTQGVVITAINAITTLLLYAPLATFYLGVGGVPVPFLLVGLSVLLFVGLPLIVGQISRMNLTAMFFTESSESIGYCFLLIITKLKSRFLFHY